MSVKQIQNFTEVTVGDKVVSNGGSGHPAYATNPRYHREVLTIQFVPEHGWYAVLGPSEAFSAPGLIHPGNLTNWWKVMPEPRTVRFRRWHRESDGSHFGYLPGVDEDRHFRDQGYILIECEGTEVLS